jgi:Uma2 family endonuclease
MTRAANRPVSRPGEPAWEIAELFPEQGGWTEEQYLALKTRRLVEFDNGMIEVLPLPTKTHQLLLVFVFEALKAFVTARGLGGVVLPAPYRVRIRPGKYREPDVIYMTAEQDARAGEDFTDAAEIVVEVVSPDDPERDYQKKRREYASAGIPEYWLVDKKQRQIIVLRLENGQYVEHGRVGPAQRAASHRLRGFEISVDDVLAQGR